MESKKVGQGYSTMYHIGVELIVEKIVDLAVAINEEDIMKAWGARTAYDGISEAVEKTFGIDVEPYTNFVNELIKNNRDNLK